MFTRRVTAIGLFLASACIVPQSGNAQTPCEPHWLNLFPPGDFDDDIDSMLLFDADGPGPAQPQLYVCGAFHIAGGQPARSLARWDGQAWSAAMPGLNGYIDALASFDEDGDGPNPPRLFAGGNFSEVDGTNTKAIARWDGANWTAVGGGFDGIFPAVQALTVFDVDGDGPMAPVLVAGGSFTSVGGVSARNIATWDAVSWSPLGQGVDSQVIALGIYDSDGDGPNPPVLVAAGSFTQAGGVPARHIAAWNGATWSPLGSGMGSAIRYSLVTSDADGPGPDTPRLIVAGGIREAGGVTTYGAAQWDGSSWAAMGSNLRADYVAVFDADGEGPALPDVYAVGSIDLAYAAARWDGEQWATIGEANSMLASLYGAPACGAAPPTLYVGGTFSAIDGVTADGIAAWDGSGWSALGVPLPDEGTDQQVGHLVVFDEDGDGPIPPALFISQFGRAGATPIGGLARWDDETWTSLLPDYMGRKLFVLDSDGPGPATPALYVSYSDEAGMWLGRWDGTEVIPIGGPLPAFVHAACFFDEDGDGPAAATLYAASAASGGSGAYAIMRFDGLEWESVGEFTATYGPGIFDMAVFDDDGDGPDPAAVYVGGRFDAVNGVPAVNVARWDGATWSATGAGLGPGGGWVNCLGVFDIPDVGQELIASGYFPDGELGGVRHWNGAEWVNFGALHSTSYVPGLAVFDEDGLNPGQGALYACGQLWGPDLSWRSGIAKLDDGEWSPVAEIESGTPYTMAMQSWPPTAAPRLYVGGAFSSMGGLPAGHLAALEGCAPLRGDLNCDGAVNAFDIDPFVLALTDPAAYAAVWRRCSSWLADCNDDGLVNAFDIDPFVELLAGK